MLSTYIIIDLLTVIALFILMLMTLWGDGYRQRLNRIYAGFTVAIMVWLPAVHVGNSLQVSEVTAVTVNYLVFGGAMAAAIFLAKIITELADVQPERRILHSVEWFLWLMVLMSMTPLVGAGIERGQTINNVVFGPMIVVYGVILLAIVLFIIEVIVRGLLAKNQHNRKQLIAIGIGILIAVPLTMIFSYILPVVTRNFTFTEFGATPTIVLVISLYYSVVKHSLFDIRLATVRTVTYLLSLATMVCVYFLVIYILSSLFFGGNGDDFNILNIIAIIPLALSFQAVKRFFDKITNKIFYYGEYDRDDFLAELGYILSHNNEIDLLLKRASHCIASNLHAESVVFHIEGYGSFGSGAFPRQKPSLLWAHEVNQYCDANSITDEVIIIDRLHDKDLKEVFRTTKTQLYIPIIVHDRQLRGHLLVGQRKSGHYAPRDIRVLKSIIGELAVAISNAVAIRELRELNDTLQQRIEDATKELRASNRQLQKLDEAKNEFISMASHQLRTPLTSIKGYLDMLLQGDMGKLSPTQRAVLREAFSSSERMVQLINDFLNVSRLQTGKFTIHRQWVNLGDIIKEEVALLRVVAEQRGIRLVTKIDQKTIVNIDADKVRQVVMNMIDNAVYYSRAKMTVTVTLAKTDRSVEFIVKDRGIGVPESEQSGLFSKFFRGSNARKRRPDGTGVGLFLAKKVVLEHDGEMIFESTENKGSVFGFRLPLRQPRSKNTS